jgi:outer membrane protein insertion porin family
VALFLFSSLAPGQQELIAGIEVRGNRRIPAETVKARIFSRAGDVYDEAALERDFNSLWNTGYFDDVRIEKVEGPKCIQLVIYVREKPTIREINYKGLSAVSQSDILDAYKKTKVSLSVESQYDPTKVKQAEIKVEEMDEKRHSARCGKSVLEVLLGSLKTSLNHADVL